MGDPQVVTLFEEFHLSGSDSAVTLDPATRADHKFALQSVHTALVALHRDALMAKGAAVYEAVAAMRPSGGVISAWSSRAAGIETGCHYPRSAGPLPKADIPKKALAPFVGSAFEERAFVVNEAFGTLECWAEGSLTMAENAAHRLGLPRPEWLPEAIYEKILFDATPEAAAAADGAAARRVVYATDLGMNQAAARAGH
jgi:hypothetical protein